MSLLIFQMTIKQWDKGHNTPAHKSARSAMPSIFTIANKPAFNIFNTPCILEQHGDDIVTNVFSQGRIRASLVSSDRVMFDRFQIVNESTGPVLKYIAGGRSDKEKNLLAEEDYEVLGQLNEHWLQVRYSWRYSVLEDNQIYWMYEEVTLNAMCAEEFDENYFLNTAPSMVFNV